MEYDFDQILDRRASESVKWGAYDEDVLPLWVADMDFISPQPVIQALQERVAQGVFGYPKEILQLRRIVVDWIAARYHWTVQPEDLVFIPGVVTGFNVASHALAVPGGNVLVQTPIYPPMLHTAQYAGMNLKTMELTHAPDGVYGIDQDAFETALDEQTRMFLLCNPHNPTGRVFRRDELERMAEVCLRKGVIICSDEIHCDLIFSGQTHIPIATLEDEVAQKTITLIAPSKTFNIAGLEFSVAIIQNPDLRSQYEKARKGLVGWPNLLGGIAAMAAYRDGLEWLEQVMAYLEANRNYLADTIRSEMPGIHMAKPQGTYLAWLDCRATGIEGNPYEHFLKNARVALNDGKMFGPGGEGFVRLNFACPRSLLAEALHRIRNAL
jgi:cystathionine beta-lyase